MRILVLGGTRFMGRSAVERLLQEGHDVTLLHRGHTGAGLFPFAPRIHGSRGALALPGGAQWDRVLDMSTYFPRELEADLAQLLPRTSRYVLCSTISAYAAWGAETTEDAPLAACDARQATDERIESYGARKAECERIATRACAEANVPLAIARPAVVFGPDDHTRRLAWWLDRARAGIDPTPAEEPMLAPWVYQRDAGAALAAMCARRDVEGAYDLARPGELSARAFMREVAALLGRALRPEPAPLADAPLAMDAGARASFPARRAREAGILPETPLRDALAACLAADATQLAPFTWERP